MNTNAYIEQTKRRIWERIEISEEGCWIWQGAKNNYGYGKLRFHGRVVYAHRVSCSIFNGPLARGKMVLHSCDNSSCCNPAHLRQGTQSTNIRHQWKRGRRKRTPIPI